MPMRSDLKPINHQQAVLHLIQAALKDEMKIETTFFLPGSGEVVSTFRDGRRLVSVAVRAEDPPVERRPHEVYLRDAGDAEDECWVPCAKGDPGAQLFIPDKVVRR